MFVKLRSYLKYLILLLFLSLVFVIFNLNLQIEDLEENINDAKRQQSIAEEETFNLKEREKKYSELIDTFLELKENNQNLSQQEKVVRNEKYELVWNNISKYLSKEKIYSEFESTNEKVIETKKNKFKLKTFKVKYITSNFVRNRSYTIYIEKKDRDLILITTNGIIFKANLGDIDKDVLNAFSIPSNLTDILNFENVSDGEEYHGIKDTLIINDEIFVTYIKEIKDDCYNVSILNAKFNLKNIKFSEYFSHEECTKSPRVQFAGGRIKNYKDNSILLTNGDYHNVETGRKDVSQDMNSIFGSIIKINKDTKNYEFLSKGNRNPQGLFYLEDKDIILSTEHGPRGGDEINIFSEKNEIINFGWPIAAYGEHYDGEYREEAPIKKPHKKYGFKEPIKYFDPSIGISEIIKVPDNIFNSKNNVYVAAMGYDLEEGDLSLHHIKFNDKYDKILSEDIIPLGDRIRDLLILKNEKKIILYLENNSEIGILEKL